VTPRHDTAARRRQQLRKAAYETAGKYGFQALTVAGIARHAGISKGIVHHYFAGKEDLIEQTVRFAHAEFRKAVLDGLRKARSPSERLWSVIDGSFAASIFQPRYRRLWLSIFEAAKTNPRLARLCEIVDRRTITHVTMPLRQLVAPAEVEVKAYTIMALMDGCWFLSVAEPQITRAMALGIVANYLRTEVPGFDLSAAKIDDSSDLVSDPTIEKKVASGTRDARGGRKR
jgi:TetR/AcrR family transcriptional repressor of bet genes